MRLLYLSFIVCFRVLDLFTTHLNMNRQVPLKAAVEALIANLSGEARAVMQDVFLGAGSQAAFGRGEKSYGLWVMNRIRALPRTNPRAKSLMEEMANAYSFALDRASYTALRDKLFTGRIASEINSVYGINLGSMASIFTSTAPGERVAFDDDALMASQGSRRPTRPTIAAPRPRRPRPAIDTSVGAPSTMMPSESSRGPGRPARPTPVALGSFSIEEAALQQTAEEAELRQRMQRRYAEQEEREARAFEELIAQRAPVIEPAESDFFPSPPGRVLTPWSAVSPSPPPTPSPPPPRPSPQVQRYPSGTPRSSPLGSPMGSPPPPAPSPQGQRYTLASIGSTGSLPPTPPDVQPQRRPKRARTDPPFQRSRQEEAANVEYNRVQRILQETIERRTMLEREYPQVISQMEREMRESVNQQRIQREQERQRRQEQDMYEMQQRRDQLNFDDDDYYAGQIFGAIDEGFAVNQDIPQGQLGFQDEQLVLPDIPSDAMENWNDYEQESRIQQELQEIRDSAAARLGAEDAEIVRHRRELERLNRIRNRGRLSARIRDIGDLEYRVALGVQSVADLQESLSLVDISRNNVRLLFGRRPQGEIAEFLGLPEGPDQWTFVSTPRITPDTNLQNVLERLVETINGNSSGSGFLEEGETGDFNIGDLLNSEIRVVIEPRAGGCNTRDETEVEVLNRYKARNPKAKDNNCGLNCLRMVNNNMPSCSNIRKKFNLSNGMINAEDLVKVGAAYDMHVFVADEETPLKEIDKELTKGSVIIYHRKKHYLLITGLSDMTNKCAFCLKEYKKTHNCNAKAVRFASMKVIKTSNETRKNAFYDFETRDLWDQKTIVSHKKQNYLNIPQIPTLLVWGYRKESGEEATLEEHLGLDCTYKFLDSLVELHKQGQYLNLYAHNASRFDAYFVFNAIKRHPLYKNFTDVSGAIIKNGRLLRFQFGGHYFLGTENFMTGSLEKLCNSFKVDNSKLTQCEVNGVRMSTLELCLYRSADLTPPLWIDFLNSEEGKTYREKYIEYCVYDVLSLMEVWEKFEEGVYKILPIEKFPSLEKALMDVCTLPGLSMKVFKTVHSFYNVKTKKKEKRYWSPSIDQTELLRFLKEAKIGGISHVCQAGYHRDSEIAAIDVCSLYAGCMLNFDYPKGEPRAFDAEQCRKAIDIGLMVIVECVNVTFGTKFINDIPLRTKTGLDWNCKFIDQCIITSIDVQRIEKHGGRLEIVKGYGWIQTYNPFKPVIQSVVDLKAVQDRLKEDKSKEYNVVLREVAKLMSNSLYGKMMEDIEQVCYKEYVALTEAEKDNLSTFSLMRSNGHFYAKVKQTPETLPPIQFGVFILAHSRNVIQHYFDDVGRENVIATETDSIYCNVRALERLEKSQHPLMKIGAKVLNMNVDNNGDIERAFFLGKKCYACFVRGAKGKFRFKGVPSKYLNESIYQQLYMTRNVKVSGIETFKRHLFSCNDTGISRTKIDKCINTPSGMIYHEWVNSQIVKCPLNNTGCDTCASRLIK